MANVTTLGIGGDNTLAAATGSGLQVFRHEIDIAEAVTAGLATTEYVLVADIPADTYFELQQVEVVTALSLGAGARIDLGDSTDDDEFITNATTLTAGTNLTLTKATFTGGIVIPSGDELRLKVTGDAIASGVLRFVWVAGSTTRKAKAVGKTYPN